MAELQLNDWPGGLETIAWAEFVSRRGGTQDGAASYEGGCQQILSIVVNWTDTKAAIQALLGTNKFNTDTSLLDRVPPAPHPVYRTLRCSRITSIRPVKFLDKQEQEGGTTSEFKYTILTCAFTMPKWLRTLTDAELETDFPLAGFTRQEWMRFCRFEPQPQLEFLTRPRDQFVWMEGKGGGDTTGPNIGEHIPTDAGQPLLKTELVVTWCRVPGYGLINAFGIPAQLEVLRGSVNSEEIFGMAIGTVLFKNYALVPQENPTPDVIDLEENGITPLMYDVQLYFSLFDPPPGSVTRGHNLFPGPNQNWYLAAYKADTAKYLLTQADLRTLFTLPGS